VLPEQGVDRRLPAAEGDVSFEDVPAPSDLEDFMPESCRGLAVENSGFLERRECVSGEDLGPLVAVVTGRVAATENVRERVRQPVVIRVTDERNLL